MSPGHLNGLAGPAGDHRRERVPSTRYRAVDWRQPAAQQSPRRTRVVHGCGAYAVPAPVDAEVESTTARRSRRAARNPCSPVAPATILRRIGAHGSGPPSSRNGAPAPPELPRRTAPRGTGAPAVPFADRVVPRLPHAVPLSPLSFQSRSFCFSARRHGLARQAAAAPRPRPYPRRRDPPPAWRSARQIDPTPNCLAEGPDEGPRPRPTVAELGPRKTLSHA